MAQHASGRALTILSQEYYPDYKMLYRIFKVIAEDKGKANPKSHATSRAKIALKRKYATEYKRIYERCVNHGYSAKHAKVARDIASQIQGYLIERGCL